MSSIKRVAVPGGTGDLGRHIVAALLKAKFEVTILTRVGSKSTIPSSTASIEVDYTSETSLTSALRNHDAVVVCLTSSAIGSQLPLFSAALTAGIKHIIPASFGLIQHEPNARQLSVIQEVVQMEDALRHMCETNPQLSYTIIACGAFLNWLLNYPLVLNWGEHTASLYDGGNQQFSCSRLGTVAKAIVGVLQAPDTYKNRVVKIHDVIVTQNKWLDIAKKVDPNVTWKTTELESKLIIDNALAELAKPENKGSVVMSPPVMAVLTVLPFSEQYEMCFKDNENKALGIEMMPESELRDAIAKRINGEMYNESIR